MDHNFRNERDRDTGRVRSAYEYNQHVRHKIQSSSEVVRRAQEQMHPSAYQRDHFYSSGSNTYYEDRFYNPHFRYQHDRMYSDDRSHSHSGHYPDYRDEHSWHRAGNSWRERFVLPDHKRHCREDVRIEHIEDKHISETSKEKRKPEKVQSQKSMRKKLLSSKYKKMQLPKQNVKHFGMQEPKPDNNSDEFSKKDNNSDEFSKKADAIISSVLGGEKSTAIGNKENTVKSSNKDATALNTTSSKFCKDKQRQKAQLTSKVKKQQITQHSQIAHKARINSSPAKAVPNLLQSVSTQRRTTSELSLSTTGHIDIEPQLQEKASIDISRLVNGPKSYKDKLKVAKMLQSQKSKLKYTRPCLDARPRTSSNTVHKDDVCMGKISQCVDDESKTDKEPESPQDKQDEVQKFDEALPKQQKVQDTVQGIMSPDSSTAPATYLSSTDPTSAALISPAMDGYSSNYTLIQELSQKEEGVRVQQQRVDKDIDLLRKQLQEINMALEKKLQMQYDLAKEAKDLCSQRITLLQGTSFIRARSASGSSGTLSLPCSSSEQSHISDLVPYHRSNDCHTASANDALSCVTVDLHSQASVQQSYRSLNQNQDHSADSSDTLTHVSSFVQPEYNTEMDHSEPDLDSGSQLTDDQEGNFQGYINIVPGWTQNIPSVDEYSPPAETAITGVDADDGDNCCIIEPTNTSVSSAVTDSGISTPANANRQYVPDRIPAPSNVVLINEDSDPDDCITQQSDATYSNSSASSAHKDGSKSSSSTSKNLKAKKARNKDSLLARSTVYASDSSACDDDGIATSSVVTTSVNATVKSMLRKPKKTVHRPNTEAIQAYLCAESSTDVELNSKNSTPRTQHKAKDCEDVTSTTQLVFIDRGDASTYLYGENSTVRAAVHVVQVCDDFVYTGSSDRSVRKYQIRSSECKDMYTGYNTAVMFLNVNSRDSGLLFAAGKTDKLYVHNIKSTKRINTHTVQGTIHSLHSNWGRLYIGLQNGTIACFDLERESLVDTLPATQCTSAVCTIASLDRDKQQVLCVAAEESPNIMLRDGKSGLLLQLLTGRPGTFVAMQINNNLLYAVCTTGILQMFNLKTGELERSGRCKRRVQAACITNSHIITTAGDGLLSCYHKHSFDEECCYDNVTSSGIASLGSWQNRVFVGSCDGEVVSFLSVQCSTICTCKFSGCGMKFTNDVELVKHLTHSHILSQSGRTMCLWPGCKHFFSVGRENTGLIMMHMQRHVQQQ